MDEEKARGIDRGMDELMLERMNLWREEFFQIDGCMGWLLCVKECIDKEFPN